MAPVYESDVAEGRWNDAEWSDVELWEKVEQRQRQKKRLWILGTVVLFTLLSCIPVVMDRWPKWITMASARKLAVQVSRLKREASLSHVSYRIRFPDPARLFYVVESAVSCDAPADQWTKAWEGELVTGSQASAYSVVDTEEALRLQLPGIVQVFCYDPAVPSFRENELRAFAFIPVKDLTESRLDRLSVTTVRGPTAAASFD